jgi:outer membrane autotransporter protein
VATPGPGSRTISVSTVRPWLPPTPPWLAPYDTIDLGPSGRLRNAGAIEAGGAGRFGRTELTGDLSQSDSGRLRFDLDAVAGRVDHLHVTGRATLAGGFELVPTTLLPGSHEMLSADGGVSLGDISPAATHLFDFTPSVEATRVSVATAADFRTEGADGATRRSVAEHLQRVWSAGGEGFATGFAALASVGDADAYADALDTLSGQSVAAIGYALYLGARPFVQASYSCPRFEDASVVRTESRCGWFRVNGSWLERDAAGGDPGFDFDAVTTAFGGQAEISDGLFVGGALGWESSRLKSDSDATTVDGDSYQGAVSLKREQGPWTLTAAVDLGWGSYDSTRQIALGTTVAAATGSPDAFNSGLHFRAVYQIPRGTWYAEPTLDVDLAYVRLDGYTESGAGEFDLKVDDSDTVVLTGTPSLKLGRRIDLGGDGVLDAFVTGGFSLSTGEDFDTTARLAGAPPGTGDFTTRLDNPNLVGRFSAGIDGFATDRIQLRLQYDGSFADGQTTNGGQFRISYFF